MRPVNLIPPEDRSGGSAPLRTGAMPYMVLGILGAALVIVYLLVSANNKVVDLENQQAELEVREQTAQQTAQALAPYAEFATIEQARSATVSTLATSRFDWSRVMNELALVTPANVYLTDLTAGAGTAASATGTAEGGAGSTSSPLAGTVTGPSVSMTGCATSQRAVADYISDLETIDGVTRVGVDNTQDAVDAGAAAGGLADEAAAAGAEGGCGDGTSFGALIAFDDAPAPLDPTAAPEAGAVVPPPTESTTTPQTAPADAGATEAAPADGAQPASTGEGELR